MATKKENKKAPPVEPTKSVYSPMYGRDFESQAALEKHIKKLSTKSEAKKSLVDVDKINAEIKESEVSNG